MSGAIRTTRWIIRFLSLGAAIFLLIGGPLPIMFQGLLPALSPLARISAIISGREWYPALFWGLPALFFTVLALWRGRLFCRWFCPTGLTAELARPVSLRRRLVKRRYAGIIFWTVLVSSIFGFPLAMLVDPLVAFARLGHIGHGTYSLLSLIPGVLVPVCLIAGFFQPSVWCTNFCPLGYFFHLCRITKRSDVVRTDNVRRDLVKGFALGAPLGLMGRYLFPFWSLPPHNNNRDVAVLPPGAGDTDRFTRLCIRCYACVTVCPTRVISVRHSSGQPLNQLFQPAMDMQRGYCAQFCTECLQVCPTGAIQKLSLTEKQEVQIGKATVQRDICLAWDEGEHCMVCEEYCPYNAIKSDLSPSDIPRPVVLPDLCRGCGICQNKCPALTDRAAIRVQGVAQQQRLG